MHHTTLGHPRSLELFCKFFDRVITADEVFEMRCLMSMFFSLYRRKESEDKYRPKLLDLTPERYSQALELVPQEDSPLLELPPELRNLVYEYVLVEGAEAGVEISKSNLSGAMALLKTCRQVRKEATPIFFSENAFHAPITYLKSHNIVNWLRIHDTQVSQIKSLSITYGLSPEDNSIVREGVKKMVASAGQGSTPVTAFPGDIFRKVNETYKYLLPQIAKTGLPMSSVTSPSVELPQQNEPEKYLLAHIARFWSSQVEAGKTR